MMTMKRGRGLAFAPQDPPSFMNGGHPLDVSNDMAYEGPISPLPGIDQSFTRLLTEVDHLFILLCQTLFR